jgi:hypothetical protein
MEKRPREPETRMPVSMSLSLFRIRHTAFPADKVPAVYFLTENLFSE